MPQSTPRETPPVPVAPLISIPGKLIVRMTNVELPMPQGKTEAVIGRTDPISQIYPEIDLTPHGGDTGGVSRQHARLSIQGGQVLLEDLNSTNGTFINRQRVNPGQRAPVNNGDEIRLGRLVLAYSAI